MTRGGYAILLLIEHAATSINAGGVLVLRYTYLECCLRHQMGLDSFTSFIAYESHLVTPQVFGCPVTR